MSWLEYLSVLLAVLTVVWCAGERFRRRELERRLDAAELRERQLRVELAESQTALRQSNQAWKALARRVQLNGGKLDG